MVRTRNVTSHAAKRDEILAAALALFRTKGYAEMTTADLRRALGISNGALFHYFPSKEAILDGIVERIAEETQKPLLALVAQPHLTAIEKFCGFFATLDRLRVERKARALELLTVWFSDGNAVVRQRIDAAVHAQRAPILSMIVHQGVREGSFANASPEQAGEVLMTLVQGMGDAHAAALLALAGGADKQQCIARITTTYTAYLDAIERVAGIPNQTLPRADTSAWIKP